MRKPIKLSEIIMVESIAMASKDFKSTYEALAFLSDAEKAGLNVVWDLSGKNPLTDQNMSRNK